ncbi:glycosyltransferase [Pandoraea sp. NPDC087047]|uniref:CgeB family protein n=1 Tax=Pandoraea sp. NPDC087047 TaxID=3364390 RepID=UPI0037FF8A70
MRILLLDTYYPAFLKATYAAQPGLAAASYDAQHQAMLGQLFGTSDFYSRHLQAMGHEAHDLIVNNLPAQTTWAKEHGTRINTLALRVPQRLRRLPVLRGMLEALPGLVDIAVEQIIDYRPDVLYCQDLWFMTPRAMARVRPYVGKIVGQIASPMPPDPLIHSYDLILTSFPHFVPRLRAMGVASEYFRIGFDTRVLEALGDVSRDIDVSFVGGISRHHGKALPMLTYLAQNTPIQFFGYGAASLERTSPIAARHRGEVWGLNMYRALARSRVTLNRHINVAENNANNMRLFEATGVGTLLITDRKDNLGELFEVGKEVVAYDSQEEAVELIRYYMDHPEEADAIARAGQARTLREHTYERRMHELVPILERYL